MERTLPDAQGDTIRAQHARPADAPGAERQAGAVRRPEIFKRGREGRILQRDGKAVSGEVNKGKKVTCAVGAMGEKGRTPFPPQKAPGPYVITTSVLANPK